jgi:hypothetical protein
VSNRLAFERYALGNENSVLRPLSRSRSQSRRLLLSLCRLSARIWTELHEKAFCGLGGCARVVVLNNFERRRLLPDVYDPTVNPLFRGVYAHYGVVALPCRIQDPARKAMFHPRSLLSVLKLLNTICPPRPASSGLRMRLRSVCFRKGARRSAPVGTIVCEASAVSRGTGTDSLTTSDFVRRD